MQEKNRHSLIRALSELPDHQPPNWLWDDLNHRLDQDMAEKPLRKALSELPDHYPPADLWEGLSVQLEQEQSQKQLKKAIDALPEYQPPDLVWESVEQQLDVLMPLDTGTDRVEKSKIAQLVPLWRRPAIAAGLTAFICALAWLLFQTSGEEKVSISYSSIEVTLMDGDEEERRDVEAFELVLDEFNRQLAFADDPELEELKVELEELDAARKQLEMAMGYYGKDAQLVSQITRIEHERSTVLKAMISKI